ncbi:hypothetical protein C7S20_08885 [Christiangramia fulva]|uniref:PDZ domain-containing protein n=1 Tax=Christiangramia fulva TaxID=2126553 RepID=A0A2R3Z534_9FLAO|nr:PDZ domain-containing protein [Christiangramia fulva]AVR45375.1 hypothetical protein C7S20_08885 [Christiangramia fulva]
MENQPKDHVGVLLGVGILFIAWGILGVLDQKNFTYSGYSTDGNNTIVQVEKGSPAEAAGLKKGDVIMSTGGIAVANTKAQSMQPRPKIGESKEYVITRNGEEMKLDLTYAALPDKQNTLNILGFLIGVIFIVLGVFMHYRRKTGLSWTFAIFMLCFGFVFFEGPYIAPGIANQLIRSISISIVLFSFGALANYMLNYPPKSRYNLKLLYLPAALAALLFWILEFTLPESTESLNMLVRYFVGAVIIFYFGLSLVTLISKFLNSNAEERKASGLDLMLIGAVIGLLPILIYFTISTFSPGTILPGNDYVFLTFIAIPIFFSLALMHRGEKELAV